MKERKYKEEYGIEMHIDDNGREKRVAVYKGDYYSLSLKPEERRALYRGSLIRLGIYLIFYLLYLLASSPSSYCIYVLPFASAALAPFAYWIMGMIAMMRAPEKMTSVHKEKGIGRVMRSSMGCMLLLLIACAGDLIFMLRSGEVMKEVPGFVLLACAAVTALAAMRQIKSVYQTIRVCGSERS